MKTIIFDAFGTLFEVKKGESARTILNHIIACGATVDTHAFLQEWKAFYSIHTAEDYPFTKEHKIFTARNRMFYNRYGIKRSAEKDAAALLQVASERNAFPEVKATLDALMENHPVFIASNTDNDVLERVMENNLITVHKVYTSENLKCYKPNPQFYQSILADAHLSPKDVLFVGDSIAEDISGPKALGIQTVLIDRQHTLAHHGQDHTITTLDELLSIIPTL